jgi:LuxR family transcriptional activator of conjugal transfer of Ti plasmids
LEELITRLAKARNQSDVLGAAHRFAVRLGCNDATYIDSSHIHDRSFPKTTLSTLPPEWIDRYSNQDYAKIDPAFETATALPGVRVVPMPTTDMPDKLKACYDEMRPFHNGTVFASVRQGCGMARLFLTYSVPERDVERFGADIRHAVHVAATYVHENLLRVEAPIVPEAVHLTDRERECLHWIAKGKSLGDTATIVGISPRTVNFHVANIRKKLDVTKTSQMLATAVNLGIISLSA